MDGKDEALLIIIDRLASPLCEDRHRYIDMLEAGLKDKTYNRRDLNKVIGEFRCFVKPSGIKNDSSDYLIQQLILVQSLARYC